MLSLSPTEPTDPGARVAAVLQLQLQLQVSADVSHLTPPLVLWHSEVSKIEPIICFLSHEISLFRSDDIYEEEDCEEDERCPSPRQSRLTPEPELPASSSARSRRMSLISPRLWSFGTPKSVTFSITFLLT